MNCKIKDIKLNCEIIGSGKPIVMLHGYTYDHKVMLGCMEPILHHSNYKRIYIDLPGMGKSESAEWITNADVMLDILIELINLIIPNENFLLAGESYGGYLSRGILYKMKNWVDGILLICPVVIADNKKRNVPSHIVLERDDRLLSELIPENAQIFNSFAVLQNKVIYERFQNEVLAGIKLGNKQFLDNFKANGYEFSFDVDKLIKRYDKPILILTGRQDASVGYKDVWDILDYYPRATFVILDKAGHNLQIEQVELFKSLVMEWLFRVSD